MSCFICNGKMMVRGQSDSGNIKCMFCRDDTANTHTKPHLSKGQMKQLFDSIYPDMFSTAVFTSLIYLTF
jgi:hypothetical protein